MEFKEKIQKFIKVLNSTNKKTKICESTKNFEFLKVLKKPFKLLRNREFS